MLNRKIIAHRYYIKHKNKILKKSKVYNFFHAKSISAQRRQYYLKNILKFRKLHEEYYKLHEQEIKDYKKQYELKHRNHKREYNANYFKIHQAEITEYVRNRSRTNINYRLASRLRTRVYSAIKKNRKSLRTLILVGCSIEQLKQHLENRFKSGMSWQNYGKWHIDHIRSCASFDLSKVCEQFKCFNYTNLQPLWAIENIKKGRK